MNASRGTATDGVGVLTRILTAGCVLVAVAVIVLLGLGRPERIDGLTLAEAEQQAVSGRLYSVAACPPVRSVRGRPVDGHWRCLVEFVGGASVEGDPSPKPIQIITSLC